MTKPLVLTRAQIVAFRRTVGALDERLPLNAASLRRAAWAGLQDSVPRSAVLSLHARVKGVSPSTWEHPSLAQVWGPRYVVYVVPARDAAAFSLGRLPEGTKRHRFAEDLARRLHAFLAGRRISYGEAGRGLDMNPNVLRYAAMTGRFRIRWDGARLSTVWTVPAPKIDARQARIELARRYLHVFGPTTASAFVRWAGISGPAGNDAFAALSRSLTPVRTPIGDAWILSSDETLVRAAPRSAAPARLLPSGDPFVLLWGRDRELLVPAVKQRSAMWTPRVWPGAVLVNGEVAGVWRRAGGLVVIESWRRLSRDEREALEAEATALPLPDVGGRIRIRWASV